MLALCSKRTANLKYIERCYEGSIHCWNVAVLNDAALLSETNDPAMQLWYGFALVARPFACFLRESVGSVRSEMCEWRGRVLMSVRLRRWLMLGLSLDPLLSKPAQEFLDAALSVMDQWSFQCTCKATEGRVRCACRNECHALSTLTTPFGRR